MIRPRFLVAVLAVLSAAAGLGSAEIQGQGTATLRIGATSTLTPPDWNAAQEKASLQSLRRFIKGQTGLENAIAHEKDWRVLVEKMEKGQYQLCVLAGYEFTWAQGKCTRLKPLALAVNGHRYPYVSLIAHVNSSAADFSNIQGQSLALPPSGQNLARWYLDREARTAGKKLDAYFSRIVLPENTEDALDNVVDGLFQVAAVDSIGWEAYRRRKPGRCKQLKEIAHSQPFPPVVVAYYDKSIDARTLERFRQGLVDAKRKQKGEVLLTLFRLTGFEEVPRDFDRVLVETRKSFPPQDGIE